MNLDKGRLKVVIAIILAADLLIFGTWFAMWSQVPEGSRSWFYQTAYQITVVEHDPDFGDTKKDQLVEQFTPGLIDMALPASAAVSGLAVAWLVLMQVRAKSRQPT